MDPNQVWNRKLGNSMNKTLQGEMFGRGCYMTRRRKA